MTTLTTFQAGDPVNWQHQVTVSKIKGAATVASEEWRDCAGHAAACKAHTATGDGWSTPSRVLLVMNPKGTVGGVGATGTFELTPGATAIGEQVHGFGRQQNLAGTPAPASAGLPPTASRKASTTVPTYSWMIMSHAGAGNFVPSPS